MEFGNFTVRNIFGYLTSLVRQSINTGATPILQLPTGAGTSIPFVLFQAGGRQDREYITNEFQILGDFEGFDIMVGAFYNNDWRSAEHTSELQSIMHISYAVFRLKKK